MSETNNGPQEHTPRALRSTRVVSLGAYELDPVDMDAAKLALDANGKEAGVYTSTVVVTDGQAADERDIEVTVEGAPSVPTLALMLAGLAIVAVVAALLMFRR